MNLVNSKYCFFHTKKGILLNGDCLKILPLFPKESIDLIILDPPYDMWEELIEKKIIEISLSLIKDSGNILLFTKPPFDYKLRVAINKYFRDELIWIFDNGQAWVSNKLPLRLFQKIYHIVKSKDYYFNPRTGLNYSLTTRDSYRGGTSWQGWKRTKFFKKSSDGTWIKSYLYFNKPNDGIPNSKPEKLIEVLIRVYSPDNGIVLDPFLGSGKTAIVCEKLNREWIGIEIEEKYCEIAKKELRKENKTKLF